jgi:hypothetical protein
VHGQPAGCAARDFLTRVIPGQREGWTDPAVLPAQGDSLSGGGDMPRRVFAKAPMGPAAPGN